MAFNFFKKKTSQEAENWDLESMFGPKMNFATSEAYKLLRTNIMFSFPADKTCHIIGVTSSVRGEGKSTTACNICYSLSEAGKKVLLLEADLRLPSISTKLKLNKSPGLTNILAAKEVTNETLQRCEIAPKMDIITAGDIPPNPSELLGSQAMETLVKKLAEHYEYIVIDLPPVSAVADALVISKLIDGIVMVVRSGAVEQRVLNDTMRQLNLVGLRILGFVFRGSEESSGIYKKKYGSKYYSKYAYSKPSDRESIGETSHD